jgi:hypothetical protein
MIVLNCQITCWPGFDDWLIFGFGVLVSIGWALYIYLCLRPKLEIGVPELSKIDGNSIIVPIANKKKYRKATRLKLDVSVIDKNKHTYHLSVIEDDFAFLAELECRDFKAFKLNEYLSVNLEMDFSKVLSNLNNEGVTLRIRLHATDSFSGLGQTFEQHFEACNSDYINCGFKIKN